MPKTRLDLAKRRFGRLRVIEFDRIQDKHAYWLCQCDCGRRVSVRATRLIRKITDHCGCLGYRRDPERHKAAREKVAPRTRKRIAKLGAQARLEHRS